MHTGTPLTPFPNASSALSWGLAPARLIKVLPAFEIAFPPPPPRDWVELCFISSPLQGLLVLYLPVLKAMSHTLIYSLSHWRQETLMKEQAARVINTYQTFNCTISE